MDEEVITHFSHEHSLRLMKQLPPTPKEHTNDENIRTCFGCKRPLSMAEGQAFRCDHRGCESIFLHKECAQLPREIMHPLHDQHSLILLPLPPYGRLGRSCCDVCTSDLDGFNYYCVVCDFNVDIKCALKEKEALFVFINKKFHHQSHEHLLIYQSRPASFCCNTCNVEDKDLSYQCSNYGCPFWIHKRCALLPNKAERSDHVHPLELIYKLPSDYLNFYFYCGVCGGKVGPMHWAYVCRPCRYFVHLGCMATEKLQKGVNYLYNTDDATFEDRLLKVLLPVDFLRLPVVDESVELIQRFLLRKNCFTNIQPMINVFSHPQHPLTLSSGNAKQEDEEILCDACIRPISTTHYCCIECKFFLHLPCAKLPVKLQHPSHPHSLTLSNFTKFYDTFCCSICDTDSNGYFFDCESCVVKIDIKCACIQTIIEHETHEHPLIHTTCDSIKICSGCGTKSNSQSLYACEPCDFYLHLICVMLPRTVGHRFDYDHPLELSFPPYPDHPEPLDCLECETEADPNDWLYRCKECYLSFHLYCALHFYNVKFGQNLKINSHPHPLKFVAKASVKFPCPSCGVDIHRDYAFECETCNFHLCRQCVITIDS